LSALATWNREASIRRATAADAEDIAQVLRQSFVEFEPLYTPEGLAATTPDEQQVRRRMDEGPVWVALWGDRIAGTAAAVPKGEKGLYVRGIAVVPSARGRGIAESLLNEVETFAKSSGCPRLFLTTTPFLSSAIRLYERCGFLRIPDGADDLFGTPLLTMAKDLSG
jgi:GNAT superfamily N-acetyltransferase